MEQPLAPRPKSKHLICGSRWALVFAVASSYFGYRVYRTFPEASDPWDHNWWNVLTWAVWALLAVFLISETRCWRERVIFGILLLQFAIGVTFSAWALVPFTVTLGARWASLVLWGIAALLSVTALVSAGPNGDSSRPASA